MIGRGRNGHVDTRLRGGEQIETTTLKMLDARIWRRDIRHKWTTSPERALREEPEPPGKFDPPRTPADTFFCDCCDCVEATRSGWGDGWAEYACPECGHTSRREWATEASVAI